MGERGSIAAQTGSSILKSVFVFIFVLLATMMILNYFLSTMFIIGLGLIIVVSFVLGYGFPAIFGFILGAALWIFGVIGGLINSISNPISNFLHGLGIGLLRIIGLG